jgi:hypothetical protein
VPRFYIEPRKPLQEFGPEVWHNLILNELAVALRRPGRDVASRLPLIDTFPHERRYHDFQWFDIAAMAGGGYEFGQFDRRLFPGAAEAMIARFASTCFFVATDIEFKFPIILAASADVTGSF